MSHATADRPLDSQRFSWHPAAWWGGAVLGASAWLVPVTWILLMHQALALAGLTTLALVFNVAFAGWLWNQRYRLNAFRGMMWFAGLICIQLPLVFHTLDALASPPVLRALSWPESNWILIMIWGLGPFIMLRFYLAERAATATKF